VPSRSRPLDRRKPKFPLQDRHFRALRADHAFSQTKDRG
jgi:hypothetical protein